MSLRDWVNTVVGQKGRSGSSDTGCLEEGALLAFAEGRCRGRQLEHAQKHLANCGDCRESVAFIIKTGRTPAAPGEFGEVSETEIRNQTALVLGHIERDQINHTQAAASQPRRAWFSYPQLAAAALVVCAVAAVSVFLVTHDETPEAAGMQTLQQAVKPGRLTAAIVSTLTVHSDYSLVRGAGDADNTQYELALAKLKFAEKETAPIDARMALARVRLAMGTRDDARRAKAILEQLLSAGLTRPELFNDLGVASFALDDYDQAVKYFNRALGMSPKYPEALFNRGLAEERLGLAADAARDWEEFTRVLPDEEWKREVQSRISKLDLPPIK